MENGRSGTRFDLVSPWFSGSVFVGMPGRFNIYNALAAIASAASCGAGLAAVQQGLSTIAVPGRVQPVPTGRDFQLVVDYAHNAASLESLLLTLREYVTGRMILLFGNAFGAYATAYSLTGGFINLITIVIGSQIKGDIYYNPGLGYALAVGMIIVMTVMMTIYYLLRRRSERWLSQ